MKDRGSGFASFFVPYRQKVVVLLRVGGLFAGYENGEGADSQPPPCRTNSFAFDDCTAVDYTCVDDRAGGDFELSASGYGLADFDSIATDDHPDRRRVVQPLDAVKVVDLDSGRSEFFGRAPIDDRNAAPDAALCRSPVSATAFLTVDWRHRWFRTESSSSFPETQKVELPSREQLYL